MTADAIRAAAADFGNCLAGLWPDAARRGISRANFQRFTAGLTPDLHIMDLLDAQPEFTKSTWDYLDLLVSDDRIARGRELLTQYAPTFAAVERAYGVDRHIIAAIWGVEFELRHAGRRPSGGAFDGDLGLRRPPPRLFPRGVPVGAGNLAARRCRARSPDRLLGRRVRSDAIHADVVQALRRRFRRRRPARRRRLGPGRDRLYRQQSENRRLGQRPDLGLRSRSAAEFRLSAGRPLAADDGARNGKASASRAPAASRFRVPTTTPFCCCRPARAGRPS